MADLVELLDLADLAVARSEGTLTDEERSHLARTASRLRSKAGYAGDAVVVAFAGGTGSGKSSLVNALVSEPVAPVGMVRPTTSGATAIVPATGHTDFTRLIEALAVDTVVRSDSVTTTILIDLPDFDSIVEAHRHIVDRVLPAVDAVVWVFDPEKYADRLIHEEFLSALAPYEDQFIFALNQTDRLGSDTEAVHDDLVAKLLADGYRSPDVVDTVASGDPEISGLVEAIAGRFDIKTTALAKTAVDLRMAANTAWRSTVDGSTDDPEVDPFGRALSAATFVWLGVEAYGYWDSLERGRHD